jgi:hypothetical protein
MNRMFLGSIKKIFKRTELLFCRRDANAHRLLLIKYEVFIKNNALYFLFLYLCHFD